MNGRLETRLQQAVAGQPRWAQLAHTLLAVGGSAVVACFEEDLDRLLSDGRVWEQPVQLKLGAPSRCHANSAALWQAGKATQLITGWALSDDGLWRQHSWCENDGQLVESTEIRAAYFGFALTREESEAFVSENL